MNQKKEKDMVKRNFVLGMVILFSFLGCGKTQATDFSADVVNTAAGKTMSGKIFVSRDNIRMEFSEIITITRMDKQVSWMLMPAQKTYMEHPLDTHAAMGTKEKVDGEIDRKMIGNEKIDGQAVRKYLVSYKNQDKSGEIYQWMRDGLAMPVKTAAKDGSWSMELKNVKFGAQDAGLFELPEGYTKFSMDGMMGGAGRPTFNMY